MPRRPRQKAERRLVVLRAPGTPDDVIAALDAALERAQSDETLAIAIIEIGREGVIRNYRVGEYDGFRHSLVAGANYLLRDLGDEE